MTVLGVLLSMRPAISVPSEDTPPLNAQTPGKIPAKGSPLHGANGILFDGRDRLYIASGLGNEIVVMDPGDDAEKPRFIETVPKRGYRLVASIAREDAHAAPREKRLSIAVLPFADMAREQDQEYFCDGLAEELTNALARLRGLRVIARTSAFAFKGKAVDIREIGRQLGVDVVAEGSVQRAEGRLRLTVHLINAADGSHLWSDRFDRPAGDFFSIEDEIAQAVVGGLKIRLMSEEEARLSARRRRYEAAIERCRKALAISPGFVIANFPLGRTYTIMGRPEEGLAALEEAAPGFPMANKAEAILGELERMSANRYVGALDFAVVYGSSSSPTLSRNPDQNPGVFQRVRTA